jgi:hypothetical protein
VIKAAMFGGTVNSCAVVDVYPIPEMMDGRNSVKLYDSLAVSYRTNL